MQIFPSLLSDIFTNNNITEKESLVSCRNMKIINETAMWVPGLKKL
jgi:hypothetical protein